MKTCIIIAGPTAIGKTALAIDLAKHFNTQIISADSRQCFKELHIGVAKPSVAELSDVHHYFINSHSIEETISAAHFEKYALDAIGEIFLKNDVAVMVGGTGLYIKAFCEGLDPIPEIDEKIRMDIINSFRQNGLAWLQEEVKMKDPLFFNKMDGTNPQRLMRALEVINATGRSVISFRSGNKKTRDFNIIRTGLQCNREKLYSRINKRVDNMISSGLLNEVKGLVVFKHLNALQTVGYNELFSFLEGTLSWDKAVDLIKQNTRHYAKRQMTWFKKDAEMEWFNIEEGPLLKKVLAHFHHFKHIT